MGEVEVLINEEWVLQVVYRNGLRALLERLRPRSSQRPRAATWRNCSSAAAQQEEEEEEEEEESFNRAMKICFLIAVTWTVISIIFYEHILGFYTQCQFEWKEIIMVVMFFAPVVAVTVFALIKKVGPPPARRREVQTISALVQEV